MSSEYRSLLDDILPNYESILRAPNLADLHNRADQMGVDIDHVFEAERQKRYKSLDSATGGVYLIQNPAVWLIDANGYRRPPPQFQCNIADARKFGTGATKKVGSTRESF